MRWWKKEIIFSAYFIGLRQALVSFFSFYLYGAGVSAHRTALPASQQPTQRAQSVYIVLCMLFCVCVCV
jgi:uncharacterized membrane protein